MNPAMSVQSLNKATGQTQTALSRLSSGSRIVETSDDAAGAAVALKMEAAIHRCDATDKNLQNADSFLRVQASALESLAKGVTRLMELKTLSLDATKNASDIANYSAEFSELRQSLVDTSNMKFNGIDLFSHTGVDTYLNLTSDENGQQQVRLTQYALGIGVTNWLAASASYQFVPGVLTWEDALADAQDKGGTLASITSAAKWAEIQTDLGADASKCMWTGGYQPPGSPPKTGWAWIDGEPFDYANWSVGQPGDLFGTPQDYLVINIPHMIQGTWDDLSTGETGLYIEGYLLKKDSISINSSASTLEASLKYITYCLANCGAESTSVGVSNDNIRTKSVNLEAAKSKITDTDIARETQNLSRAQVLSQISAAMVKQSAEAQKTILKLIEQRLAGT